MFSFRDHSEAAFKNFRHCLLNIVSWMTDNCLKLNTDETEVLFFNQTSPVNSELWWPTELNPAPVLVQSARNLGVKFDASLSGKAQIGHVSAICFWKLKMLRRFLYLLPMACRQTVVHALVTSQLDYVNSLYLSLPDYLILKLQRIQNAAAWLIRNVPLRHHITPHLRSLHWLPVKRRIQFKVLTLAFRIVNDTGPMYLKTRLPKYRQNRTLRSNNQRLLAIPRFKRARLGGRSVFLKTALLWNSMPQHLRLVSSEPIFRKSLKTWLFNLP